MRAVILKELRRERQRSRLGRKLARCLAALGLAVAELAMVGLAGRGSFLGGEPLWAQSAPAPDATRPVAQWIWGTERAHESAPAGRCDFQHTFHLSRPIEGLLRIGCDNRYLVRLNGRLIGMGDRWQQQDAYQVDTLLRSGENTLQVSCANDEAGPAGLAVELTVREDGDRTQTIVTNDQWQTRVQPDGTWNPRVQIDATWSPAFAAGAVGSAAPWGSEMRPATDIKEVRARVASADGKFELVSGDRVVFLGGTLIERAQRYGYFEAALASAFPTCDVRFRNLGWSGDTVSGHARARFGTVADGFEHLETHVFAEQPSWIFVAYGGNEAFAGDAGLADFNQGLNHLLDVLSATGAQLVLVTPPPLENLGPPLPDPHAQNENLEKYATVIRAVAEERGCLLVDLFAKLPSTARELGADQPLTDNGMHLDARGYWYASQTLLRELGLPVPRSHVEIDAQASQGRGEGADLADLTVTADRLHFNLREHALIVAPPAETAAEISSLRVSHLPPGQYALVVDGQAVVTASADDWALGLSTVEIARRQSDRLLAEMARKNELYFHRWRPQNETYLFLFRKHEQGNNAVEIPQFDPLIAAAEQAIAPLRSAGTHAYELIRRADPAP